MGKRVLNTRKELKFDPTVRLADKVGSRFVGRFIETKTVNINGKPSQLHKFNALDGDALITIKDGSSYREADIKEGDVVSVFGSSAINTALEEVRAGEVVELVFNGEKKLKGGRRFNDVAVAILEDSDKEAV